MGSRRLSIFSRTTPVPTLSDPISTGSAAVTSETSRVYPGVFALATLLEVVSISCWLTESPLRATERDPNKPDIVILQHILRMRAGLPSEASRDRACRWARNRSEEHTSEL